MKVTGWFGTIFLVSLYCIFGGNIIEQVEYLRRVARHASGHRLILGLDANASSDLWHRHSVRRDQRAKRGEILAELIGIEGWIVLNKPSGLFTCNGPQGYNSNIDVTLRSSGWGTCQFEWDVLDVGISDHNVLQTIVWSKGLEGRARVNVAESEETPTNNRSSEHDPERGIRWRKTQVYWPLYENMINNFAADHSVDEFMSSENLLRLITEWSTTVGDELKGRVKGICRARKVQWWSDDLTELKRTVRICKRKVDRLKFQGRDSSDAVKSWRAA